MEETYEYMLTTPTQSVVLMAASTALPPFLSTDTPMLEHSSFSLATAPCLALMSQAGLRPHDLPVPQCALSVRCT
jgi:hypothetical protein